VDIALPPELIRLLRQAGHSTVLTGAGVSQESGLRTFRDAKTGLWSQYRPEDLATPEAFERNPQLIWDWYALRRSRAGDVQPNPGHYALAEMERRSPAFTLVTQNVDGLHQRAGSLRVIELHGNIARVRCSKGCGLVSSWQEIPGRLPSCPTCGSNLRPDVVWFGESLPRLELEVAVEAARSCEVFISVGTSGLVQPAASLAYAAAHRGAAVVEVNTEKTALSSKADFLLIGRSGEILPELVRQVWGGRRQGG
jgi:NAD-dependent deacetylase